MGLRLLCCKSRPQTYQ